MAPRITYRRRLAYNTPSNKIRKVRTPGSKLSILYPKKKVHAIKCGEAGCGLRIQGIKRVRPVRLKGLRKRERTVSRAYGGNLCAKCVKNRAFLIEEVKIVKKVMQKKKE